MATKSAITAENFLKTHKENQLVSDFSPQAQKLILDELQTCGIDLDGRESSWGVWFDEAVETSDCELYERYEFKLYDHAEEVLSIAKTLKYNDICIDRDLRNANNYSDVVLLAKVLPFLREHLNFVTAAWAVIAKNEGFVLLENGRWFAMGAGLH